MAEIVQIVGYKNSGKTTLAEYLVGYFSREGKKVAVLKHDAHEFEIDHSGTDTWRMTQAGAAAVAITSPKKTAIIMEQSSTLTDLVTSLDDADMIIVEGFKREDYPKIVMLRRQEDLTLLKESSRVIATVSWEEIQALDPDDNGCSETKLPRFRLGENREIAEWLKGYLEAGR